jgi:hypothetical protein
VCGIILFSVVIVLLRAVGVVLVVGTYYTSVVFVIPVCTNPSL